MAFIGYYSSIPWEKRLLTEHITRDLNGQIRKSAQTTNHTISTQTKEIVASNEALAQTFGKGFDTLNNTLEWGLADISYALEDLRADFNYGIALVLSQLQAQNEILLGILDKLDSIHKTLENPTHTQAREFYRIGCDRLIKGLLDKALESFLQARAKNDADFFIEYQIGKLYLYGRDEDDNVTNPEKAEEHLRDAFRYGKVELGQTTDLKSLVAETALHASIACYAQATELHLEGKEDNARQKLKDACHWAKQSLDFSPLFLESNYHLAKYSALLGDEQTSISNLALVVQADRKYCLKADIDSDFDPLRSQVQNLFLSLKEEARKRAEGEYKDARNLVDDMIYLEEKGKKAKQEICDLLEKARQKLDQDRYFDYLDFIKANLISEVKSILVRLEDFELSKKTTLEGHYKDVFSVCFSPDGKFLASGGWDGVVNLWQANNGQLVSKLEFFESLVHSVSFSPNGKFLAAGGYRRNKVMGHKEQHGISFRRIR